MDLLTLTLTLTSLSWKQSREATKPEGHDDFPAHPHCTFVYRQANYLLKMISDVDDDGSGAIGYEEFLKMVARQILNPDPRGEILKAFRLFDDVETGEILSRT